MLVGSENSYRGEVDQSGVGSEKAARNPDRSDHPARAVAGYGMAIE